MAVPGPGAGPANRHPCRDHPAALHGINVRIARNGALAALAADLPAAVLADLLGMHINTAVRWVKYVGRDWADYIAARAIEQG